MGTLESYWSPALLRALGFALLHSLWQGGLLALLLGLLLRGLRQQAAVVRYRLAAVALATMVGLAWITFGHYYLAHPLAATSHSPLAAAPATPISLALHSLLHALPAAGWQTLAGTVGSGLQPYLPVMVGLWALGFGTMTLRLLVSFAYVRRLRHARLGAVPMAWQECLERLTRRAGLARPVQLVTSGLVPSPLVIGHLKPLILLPISMLAGLDPVAVEMLLAHELAHIIRRDYLFNALQAVAETIFFYHPAVWYMAAVLHVERENCCDDLATQLGGNPRQLAHALAALAERAHAGPLPRLALAATGPATGSLLRRVRRLAQRQPVQAHGFWPSCCALLAAGVLLGGLLFATRPPLTTTDVYTRRSSTTKSQPDDAPQTGQRPLAQSDDALQGLFQTQLRTDGLLPDSNRYRLALTASQLLVNGHLQDAAFLARYHHLYESATGYRMTATTVYSTETEVLHEAANSSRPQSASPELQSNQSFGSVLKKLVLTSTRQLCHDKAVADARRAVITTLGGPFPKNGHHPSSTIGLPSDLAINALCLTATV